MSLRGSRRAIAVAVLVVVFGLIAAKPRPAQATLYVWNSTNAIDSWHAAGNWSPAGGPQTVLDEANINNGKLARVTDDATVNYLRIFTGGVVQDSGNFTPTLTFCGLSGTGTYVLNGGNLTTWLTVGQSSGTGNDFTLNNGTMTTTHLWLGNHAAGGTFHMNGGSLTVKGDFEIASHEPTIHNVKATFIQTGGDVNVDSAVRLNLGERVDSAGWAKYELFGGTLTLNRAATPLYFAADPGDIYFNFGYGSPTSAALNLKGTWDFASLTSIANADFRVYGSPATSDTLRFVAGTGPLAGYTIVYATPEPSTIALAALAFLGAVLLRRRAR